MGTSKFNFLLLTAVLSFALAYHNNGEASQNELGTNNEIKSEGSAERGNAEEHKEEYDDFQEIATEPKKFNDEKNPPRGSKKQGSSTGSRRALPALAATVLKNPKVQEAVVDKGLEVMNKLVDKQLRIIDEAQEKASKFLAKEIKLDIMPDKGWSTPDMFVPPGYHMGASISGVPKDVKEEGDIPYTYAPATGLGYVMMNGCWGKNYTASDPCYNAKWTSSVCQNMIDGAAFLGVGFDGRGEYSPQSRKMSIVQRNCKNKATYDTYDVPDTMNVHGIYDTSATMHTFESRGEFQKYLQQEAGVSGSYFGFYAGAKKAWGSSYSEAHQMYLSVLDVDVVRYEVFMDEVKPQDLSVAFLREFMSLPNSYFKPGAAATYQGFIQRWGTHYIKSAKFGGELEIRKTMDAKQAGTKTQFSEKMEAEYKSLFASVGAKYKKEGGESVRQETKTTSTAVEAKGGSQDIASILSDVYSPTFKTEFKEWLQSIPQYPKAFKFQMSSISDLVNFRANDLFPDEKVKWGCEGKAAELETEKDGRKFYYAYPIKDKKKKIYCKYDSRQSLETAIMEKRTSLQRAIAIYMEEGPVSLSDFRLEKCPPEKKTTTTQPAKSSDKWMDQKLAPKWQQLISSDATFQVTFDLLDDLINPLHRAFSIHKNMSRSVRYRNGDWYTSDSNNAFHMYSGFSDATNNPQKPKISIFGLTLSFNQKDGSLYLDSDDFKTSKKVFPALSSDMTGKPLARVESVSTRNQAGMAADASSPSVPCHAEWSNILRMELEDMEGKCLHFTAASKGTIYVVFSASPKNVNARYVIEISSTKVVIFKGAKAAADSPTTTAVDAVALGESVLYESYLACITISGQATLIEYGKTVGAKDAGSVYLNMIDRNRDFDIRFYAFGNQDEPANIMDAHIVSHKRTGVTCNGNTVKDTIENLCAKNCHNHCNPVAGCKAANSDEQCYACRVVKEAGTNRCLEECPSTSMINKKKECVKSYDAKMEGNYLVDRDISVGDELSTCVWLKTVEGTWKGTRIYLVWLFMKGMNMLTHLVKEGENIILQYVHGGIDEKRNVDVLKDKAWHQLCNLWSSKTAAWSIYLDGKRLAYGTYNDFIGRRLGKLQIAQSSNTMKMLITQVNLWDRVLTSQEIKAFAKTCNEGIGNLLSWADLYDKAKKSRYTNGPSSCKGAPEFLSPTPSTTAQAVTKKAPPEKRVFLYKTKMLPGSETTEASGEKREYNPY